MKHESRGIEPSKGAIEADRLALERCAETLARNDLKDITRFDIIAGRIDHVEILVLRGVRGKLQNLARSFAR